MIIVGLTGSIAMGKSETAKMFGELDVPVFDVDEAVHELYGKGGEAVGPVGDRFPHAIVDGSVDRDRLAEFVLKDKTALKELEAIVHPLVRRRRLQFVQKAREAGKPLVVLDIPLLFETGSQSDVDRIVVVSAPPDVQRSRALRRPGMTAEKFEAILREQTPDAEKRRRADFVVDSSGGLDAAKAQVVDIVRSLRG